MRIGDLREELYELRRYGNSDEKRSSSTILGLIDGIDDSFVVSKLPRTTPVLIAFAEKGGDNEAVNTLRHYLDIQNKDTTTK